MADKIKGKRSYANETDVDLRKKKHRIKQDEKKIKRINSSSIYLGPIHLDEANDRDSGHQIKVA